MVLPYVSPAKPLIPAAAYLRMSDPRQDTSIEIQKRQLEEWAERNGYRIIAWYADEGVSGSSVKKMEKREQFMRMLADAPSAEWQAVVCVDLSRFGRQNSINASFAKKVMMDCRKWVHTIAEGKRDYNKRTDRMLGAIEDEMKNEYAATVADKTLNGKLYAFLNDRLFGFRVPYGLARKVIDDQGNVRFIPRTMKFRKPKEWDGTLIRGDDSEVAIVVWLFETFGHRDVGYRWLASDLNRRSIPSPTGGLWGWERVAEILQNEKYCGDRALGKTGEGENYRLEWSEAKDTLIVSEATTTKSVTKTPLIRRNTHDGIIERELFDIVQAKILRRQAARSHSPKEGGYMLKDVLFCGNCGKPLYGITNIGPKKSGRTKYICKRASRVGKHCDCAQWFVYEDVVLPWLLARLASEMTKTLRKIVSDAALKPPPHRQPQLDLDRLRRRLDDLERDVKLASRKVLLSEDDADLQGALADLRSERDKAREDLNQAEQDNGPTWDETLQRRRLWLEGLRDKVLWIKTYQTPDGKYGTSSALTPDGFREMLVSQQTTVEFWWTKKTRWEVCKVRLRLFGTQETAQLDGFCSLIVWCGERKGRVANNASPGLSRPVAL